MQDIHKNKYNKNSGIKFSKIFMIAADSEIGVVGVKNKKRSKQDSCFLQRL